ncbi:DUF1405 domain-containing protein [Bacillus sp. RG28]|uniref:DUF1405 domain-containing protein n=2 Tax=Gottfriedia endophytica TaxID=2820819 RepID=A0A940NL64_9BACI|nr:DUF1405 domain-containing protein [Gottfriedia endophytica]
MAFLRLKSILWILFIVNLLGTIYGYYWYRFQIEETVYWLRIFVPDSPTASLFLCIVLLGYLMNQQNGLIEALAFVSLIKYGIWAVVMNCFVLFIQKELNLTAYLLIFSHAAMAFEAILFAPFFKVKAWQLIVASIVILQDVIFDYVFNTMPTYYMLFQYRDWIGLFTFYLSVFAIFLGYSLLLKKNRLKLNILR